MKNSFCFNFNKMVLWKHFSSRNYASVLHVYRDRIICVLSQKMYDLANLHVCYPNEIYRFRCRNHNLIANSSLKEDDIIRRRPAKNDKHFSIDSPPVKIVIKTDINAVEARSI